MVICLCALARPALAQDAAASEVMRAYKALHSFVLDGGSAKVSNLLLKRDRAEMTFTGTFYFSRAVMGKVTGAVFVGQGRFRAEPPDSVFEKENLRRLLNADAVDSDFETAVLRFTDDSDRAIGLDTAAVGPAPSRPQQLATDFEEQFLKETGANAASRLLLSLRDDEAPGVFLVQFDGGRRGRFTFLMDHQARIPSANFYINGGEKGLIFTHERKFYTNTVWLAFPGLEDNTRDGVAYSDAFDLVDVSAYALTVDLREPRKALKVSGRIDLVSKVDHLTTVPFMLTEGLPEKDKDRLKKAIRVASATIEGGPVEVIQEEWEGGFTVLLPAPRGKGERFSLEFESSGDFINDEINPLLDVHYPLIDGEWYPRHGYLARSQFEITFLHRKGYKVASVGDRVREAETETVYRTPDQVSMVSFAVGAYKIHTQRSLEFFSAGPQVIREDLMLGEMGKALDFFSESFGPYPYKTLRAAFHPFAFGQAFPSLLLLPNANPDNKAAYLFIAHETAHQWWGNLVSWRSYRDQWLSEGFAEYSGMLYTARRDKPSAAREQLVTHRDSLKDAPRTVYGVLGGKVTDIGPLILGQRLASIDSTNAYQRLIYRKGALVLRMLHFLLADPETGSERPFFDMMTDFVERHRSASATTEQFIDVANEHFARSPIARQFGMTDLKWFFNEWVWLTALPSYRFEYAVDRSPDGGVLLNGTLFQDNATDDWIMPIPLVLKFAGGRIERRTVLARGARRDVALMLGERPESVELDPDLWVLSEKTSTRKR